MLKVLLADRIILERLLVNATLEEDQIFIKRLLDENAEKIAEIHNKHRHA